MLKCYAGVDIPEIEIELEFGDEIFILGAGKGSIRIKGLWEWLKCVSIND